MKQSEVDKLLADADRRAVYRNQVEHAKEKFKTLNMLYRDGHPFTLIPSLFSYVGFLMADRRSHIELSMAVMPRRITSHILLDDNDEPVLIPDLAVFLEEMEESHTEALNQYYDLYAKLKAAKNSEELIQVH